MYVKELWRYPVKSMRGEPLVEAEVAVDGIVGDRLVQVQDSRGLVTARRRSGLLGLRTALDEQGIALVEGKPWWHPDVDELVKRAAGPQSHLVARDGPERFDILPLLVATDGAIAAFGKDGRRLRPNIVIGGVDGLSERDWPGSCLRIGQVLIGVQDLRLRCIMTSYDPETLSQDKEITRDIYRRFQGKLALNCFVIEPGPISAGDDVQLVRGRACTDSAAMDSEH